eukprot:GHVL01005115.1.p1 GENE.GHVL01005115.1~~GHVL01005115.1.p1  ORF type:complete len:125 (-),score=5.38 GHVL01005115.1:121-495(-)
MAKINSPIRLSGFLMIILSIILLIVAMVTTSWRVDPWTSAEFSILGGRFIPPNKVVELRSVRQSDVNLYKTELKNISYSTYFTELNNYQNSKSSFTQRLDFPLAMAYRHVNNFQIGGYIVIYGN